MKIDIKILDSCTELTDYDRDLIERIDVRHETQTSIADSYGKTPSTASIQHKKALRKLARPCEESARGTLQTALARVRARELN